MNIGIFTDTYVPYINGVTTSVLMLKNALEKLGYNVYVVTVNNENLHYKYEEEEKVLRLPGIPIGIYDYRLTSIYPIEVIKLIKSWNLDVIHCQTEFGVGTFARIFAKQFNIPLVHTYHTMYEDYVHYITKGYFKNSSKKIVEYLTKFYCDKTCTELVVPTRKTYELFKDKYKYDREVYIVPTGIEIDRFYEENHKGFNKDKMRKELGFNKDDFIILFVGRIAQEKNINLLLDSMKALQKESKKIKLLIVGDGPDLPGYKEYAKKNKIDDSVIFAGKIPWVNVPEYYLLSDVFATASTSETQGLTVIEGLAASLPVVCINDESFNTTIMNDYNGYIFNTNKEYEKYIIKIFKDKKLQKKLREQARRSSEQYSSKYFAERIVDVYKKAIEHKKKKKGFFLFNLFKRKKDKE